MTFSERQALRLEVSARTVARLGIEQCPSGWGSQYGYRYGCRCSVCCHDATTKRRERRQQLAAQ